MDVGRLEVGTETLVDKSKSTKTILMDLFPAENTDIEGATIINACYGGTAALLNAFSWVESSGWDGRYAIVVAADIATYARGPARPTCGCGAVALLIGRDAPIAFDPKFRATHASNTWDFFKPDHTVEYPVVDGAHSQLCYYRALEDCYMRFCAKMESSFTAETPDYFCFHAPYNKLVQKSYGRLFLCDARRHYQTQNGHTNGVNTQNGHATTNTPSPLLEKEAWLTMPMEETYSDKELEGVLKKCSAAAYQQRLADANYVSQWVGNTYTASVFLGMASLMDRKKDMSPGQSIVVFSYGSGALATMYRLQMYVVSKDSHPSRFLSSSSNASLPFASFRSQSYPHHTNQIYYNKHVKHHEFDPTFAATGRSASQRIGFGAGNAGSHASRGCSISSRLSHDHGASLPRYVLSQRRGCPVATFVQSCAQGDAVGGAGFIFGTTHCLATGAARCSGPSGDG